MKLLFAFSFGLFFFGSLVFSQEAPPAPLIYKAPDKSSLQEFTAEDKTFQVTFPCVPQIKTDEIENSLVTSVRCYRQGSTSLVNITEFDFEVENQRENVYKLVKELLLKAPKTEIVSDKEIEFNEKPAAEIDLLQNYHYQKIRILVVGNKVYEMKTDVTNWHIIGDPVKESYFSETARFFNSFKLLNFDENVSLQNQNDFLGKVQKTGYTNSFFNFSIAFPEHWQVLSDQEIEVGKALGQGFLKTQDEKVNKAFRESIKREVLIFAVTEKSSDVGNGANLAIGVLKQPNSRINAEKVANATKDFFITNPKIKLVNEPKNIKLDGKDFSTFSIQTTLNEKIISQNLYITIINGYSVTFVISYTDLSSLKDLETIIESLKIKAK